MAKEKTDKKKTNSPKTKRSLSDKVTVHYLKTKNYRTYHVDGIFGGLTPSGDFYIELFVQRSVTPKVCVHEILQDGILGKEMLDKREGKKGIIREIESGLVMNIEVAKTLRKWIDGKIEQYEQNKIT